MPHCTALQGRLAGVCTVYHNLQVSQAAVQPIHSPTKMVSSDSQVPIMRTKLGCCSSSENAIARRTPRSSAGSILSAAAAAAAGRKGRQSSSELVLCAPAAQEEETHLWCCRCLAARRYNQHVGNCCCCCCCKEIVQPTFVKLLQQEVLPRLVGTGKVRCHVAATVQHVADGLEVIQACEPQLLSLVRRLVALCAVPAAAPHDAAQQAGAGASKQALQCG